MEVDGMKYLDNSTQAAIAMLMVMALSAMLFGAMALLGL